MKKGKSNQAKKNYMSLAWFSAHALPVPAGAPAARESLGNAHSGAIVMDQA
jgi:hypothetical protein